MLVSLVHIFYVHEIKRKKCILIYLFILLPWESSETPQCQIYAICSLKDSQLRARAFHDQKGKALIFLYLNISRIYWLYQWLVNQEHKVFLGSYKFCWTPGIATPVNRRTTLISCQDLPLRNKLEAIIGKNCVMKDVKRLSDWVS